MSVLLCLTLVACNSNEIVNNEEVDDQVNNYDSGEVEENIDYDYSDDFDEELYIEDEDYSE